MTTKTHLETLFLNLASEGYKKPTLRADGFIFKLAPVHGSNPGAVYVTREADGEYLGKIHHGKLKIGTAYQAHEVAIEHVAMHPMDAALRYGRKTGNCAICGRHLDNAESVAAGIGPICAEKFGFLDLIDQRKAEEADIDWSIL